MENGELENLRHRVSEFNRKNDHLCHLLTFASIFLLLLVCLSLIVYSFNNYCDNPVHHFREYCRKTSERVKELEEKIKESSNTPRRVEEEENIMRRKRQLYSSDYSKDYYNHMVNNYGSGVQSHSVGVRYGYSQEYSGPVNAQPPSSNPQAACYAIHQECGPFLVGPPGAPGPRGYVGAPGVPGMHGTIGPKGEDGAQGPRGYVGLVGMKGAPGPKGDSGAIGPKGRDGAPGTKGDTDTAGTDGAQGPKGDTGADGPTGKDGAQGPKGDTGTAGEHGPPGPKGDTGAPGPKGDTGAPGPKGDTGADGRKGKDGSAGPKGDTGAPGPKGNAGTIEREYGAGNGYVPDTGGKIGS